MAYSASPGTYILTGSADRSIRLYNPTPSTAIHPANSYITKQQQARTGADSLPEGRLIQSYQAHSHEVLSLSVSADNARFASSGGDRTVFLWDVATAQTVRRFSHHTEGHVGRVNCVAMGGADDPESHPSLVISGGFDTTVRVWDARAGGTGFGRPVQVLDDAADAISAVAVRGADIIAGSVDGRVRSYDVRVGRVTVDVVGASVTSLGLSSDGKALLVGSLDSRVRLMDRESGSCLRAYGGGAGGEDDDSRGWANTDLRVQSVLGGKEKYVVAGDEMTGTDRDGHVASDGGRLWAWDLMTGKLAAKVKVPWGPAGTERLKKVVGRDGKEKERKYVVSCLAWRESGFGDQFCAGGTSGAVTVFGPS